MRNLLNQSVRIRALAILGAFPLVVAFQNCTRLAPAVNGLSSSSTTVGGEGGGADTGVGAALDGKALYATKCAACHGAFAVSTKLGKSLDDIRGALGSVPSMRATPALIALTPDEIEAIADALSGVVAAPAPVAACDPKALRGVANHGVRRLTKDELVASMDSVVPGVSVVLKPQLDTYPDTDIVEEVDRFDNLHSRAQVVAWAEVVDSLTDYLTSRQMLGQLGDSCVQSSPVSADCWTKFFQTLGRKVYRRPLQANEVTALAQLAQQRQTDSGTAAALYGSVQMLFRSPAFLFHFEIGTTQDASRVRLSDHEVANRISFGLLGGPPDQALASAADQGQLKTTAQVESHVRRLIESDASKGKFKKFLAEWLELSHIQPPQNEYMVFFRGTGGNGNVDKQMTEEIEDYVNYTVFRTKGNFQDLMTQPIAFPRFQGLFYSEGAKPFSSLAGVYGGDKYKNFTPENQAEAVPYPAPNNPGLLTRAGFMSSARFETQPITRGVFVQRRILCEDMPSPDFSVVSQRLNEVGDLDPKVMANHQIVTARTGSPACIACHGKINPVGFALEAYDMIGRYRPVEEVLDITKFYSEIKGVVATHPLPTPVSNVIIGDRKLTINDASDLARQVASSEAAKMCVTKFYLRHLDRRKENVGDSCLLNEATQPLRDGRPMIEAFVKTIANEDVFWRRK